MNSIKRNNINLLNLKAGEIIELKQELFLKNLRYVRQVFVSPYRSDVSWWKYCYVIGGREFWIDDDSLHDLLLHNRKLIDTLVLEANEWHPELTDDDGNPIFEDDDERIPALNMDITKKNFFFIVAIKTDEVAYYDEVTRREMITKAKAEQIGKKEERQNEIKKKLEQKYESGWEYPDWKEYPDAYERSDDELNGDFDSDDDFDND